MVLLNEYFETVDFEKNQQTTKKHEKKNPRGQIVNSHVMSQEANVTKLNGIRDEVVVSGSCWTYNPHTVSNHSPR